MFDLPGDKYDESIEAVAQALRAGGLCTLSVTDSDGDVSHLLITQGCSVSFHPWAAPNFNVNR